MAEGGEGVFSRTLLEELLVSGLDDWVDASQVMSIAAGEGGQDTLLYRDTAFGLIAEALFGGYMVPGLIEDATFSPWGIEPKEAFFRIFIAWTEQWGDKIPDMGAVVWLDLTELGESVARRVVARESN